MPESGWRTGTWADWNWAQRVYWLWEAPFRWADGDSLLRDLIVLPYMLLWFAVALEVVWRLLFGQWM
jgi:hypothetical protein